MKRPWMPLYIADYLKDTTHLGALESGAYLHLIMDYWQNGKLPNDDRHLARIAKLTDREWKRLRPVLADFFDDGWVHKRIDSELAKSQDISDKRRLAAEEMHKQRNGKKDANAGADAHTVHTSQSTSERASSPSAERAFQARIADIYIKFGCEPLPDMGLCDVWLAQKYDPDLCVAVVSSGCARIKQPKVLSYWSAAIREAHEKRNPAPAAKPEILWDTIAAAYARGKAMGDPFWPPRQGPSPGESGCRCPPEILRKHGVNPETGAIETVAA